MKERIGEYDIQDIIGKGSFGTVKLAIHHLTQQKFAVKCAPRSAVSLWECNLLKTLNHPNIVRLYDSVEDGKQLCLILELIDGGDLMSLLKKKKVLKESEAQKIFLQLCLAISHCHSRGIVHRDIKLENVLLTAEGQVKLIDFGVSLSLTKPTSLGEDGVYGSLPYASPEILKGQEGSKESDVWSLGVLLYCLVTGRLPFTGDSVYGLIVSGRYPPPPPSVSPCVRDLIKQMLTVDPRKRLSITQVLEHPWLNASIQNHNCKL